MPRNVYWDLYYHITWHTKNSVPQISGNLEKDLHQFLRNRILQNPESIVHAIGGIEDHLQMAVSIPPTILIADWIGDLKGASSYTMNHSSHGSNALHWQIGYGIVSYGQKDLPWVVEYIRNQREHHYKGTFADRMERITQIETQYPGDRFDKDKAR